MKTIRNFMTAILLAALCLALPSPAAESPDGKFDASPDETAIMGRSLDAIAGPDAFAGPDNAVEQYRRQAAEGKTPAMFELGLIYYNGSNGVQKDIGESMRWFRMAADRGHSTAMSNLGALYTETGNPREGFKWVEKAAKTGNDFAQRVLGQYYRDGTGVDKDTGEAAHWFEQSANNGNDMACFYLGLLYDVGAEDFGTNGEMAMQWYRLGEERGNPLCIRNIGIIHNDGDHGYPVDKAKAQEYFLTAARKGDALAALIAGVNFFTGAPNLPQDYAKAKRWLLVAKEGGNPRADEYLGKIPANVQAETDQVLRVAADDLIAEFARDPKAANQKYKGKILVLSRGSANSRVNMTGNRAEITLSSKNSPITINCIVVSKSGSLNINTGGGYGYRGLCSGYSAMLGVISMGDCENIKL